MRPRDCLHSPAPSGAREADNEIIRTFRTSASALLSRAGDGSWENSFVLLKPRTASGARRAEKSRAPSRPQRRRPPAGEPASPLGCTFLRSEACREGLALFRPNPREMDFYFFHIRCDKGALRTVFVSVHRFRPDPVLRAPLFRRRVASEPFAEP